MAFFRSGLSVTYIDIKAKKRVGKSHISPIKDGLKFLLIIVKIASLYSPLKVYTPIAATLGLFGSINYLYTFITAGSFTNMSALLLIMSVIIFMLGLLAEQITVLTYAASERRRK